MPSIKSWTRILCVTAACFTLLACGKANEKAPAIDSGGKHPDSWLAGHRAAYQQNRDQCRGCHGIELKGGITKVDCFNQGALGSCHANGHGPRAITHEVPFKDPSLHGAKAKIDLIICQDCHGAPGGAGSNPGFKYNITNGISAAGCELSGCHNPNMAHPKPWKTHAFSGNQANACALCHGVNFEGSPSISAPSCKNCHTQLVAGLPPYPGQCISCHGNPPSGTITPNRNGSHAAHIALFGMSGNCAACHTGGGSGTANHGTTLPTLSSAAIVFASGFAPAAFDGTTITCTSVSCHGGRTTPNWNGGIIELTNCTSCHQTGTADYPNYHSGQHALHMGISGIACADCHDVTNKASHFKNVTTKIFETAPLTTLHGSLNYTVQKSCTVTNPVLFTGCHSDKKDWLQ